MTKNDVMAHFDRISTDPRVTLDVAEAHLAALTDDAYLYDRYHVNASGGSTGRRGVMVTDWDGWCDGFISLLRGLRRMQQRDAASRIEGRVQIGAVVAAVDPLHMSTAMPQTFDDPASTVWHRFPVTLPFEQILAGLAASQPDFIVGYPSMLHLLAFAALDGRLAIAPRVIVSASEPLTPAARAAIERAWSARLINWWVTTEAAGIAMSCGFGPGMHLSDDTLIVEPMDAQGRAVAPGIRAAKVYVTNLINPSPLPLIRYEITDQVTVLETQCPCGSAHRLIDDVQGRLEDIFRYGAVTIHPVLFCTPLERTSHVVEYQVRQTSRGADIALCATGDLDLEGLRREITASLSTAGLCSPEVSLTRVPSIERQHAGKLRRFVALRCQ
jgi:phenylacetate-coenzyme A ligase PaaK-like adenylate-forming protein